MARINLLPWREQEREVRKNEFFVLLGGSCAFVALFVFVAHLVIGGFLSEQQARNGIITQEINGLNTTIRAIAELKNTKDQIFERIQLIQKLQLSRPQVVRLFDQVVEIVPNGVYLTDLKREGEAVYLEGMAESNIRISMLMRNVNGSEWLKHAKLSEIKTRNPRFLGAETKAFKLQFSERPYEGGATL